MSLSQHMQTIFNSLRVQERQKYNKNKLIEL